MEDLHGARSACEGVTLCETEEPQDLLGSRSLTLTLLGVDRQLCDARAFHRQAQLSFDEGLHQECQKIQGEERFDPAGIFEKDWGDLVHGVAKQGIIRESDYQVSSTIRRSIRA